MRDSHVHVARPKTRTETRVGVAKPSGALLLVRSDTRHSRLADGSSRSCRDFDAPGARGVLAWFFGQAEMKNQAGETSDDHLSD